MMTDTSQRIKELNNILEATKLLNASKDLDFILKELMNTALKLIRRADIGIIFLYDNANDVLRSKYSFGFGEMDITLKPGESITGITFSTMETLHLDTPQKVAESMMSMGKNNKELLNKKIIKPMDQLLSSISCPLVHGNECIGVFVLDNYIGKEPFTKDDVYLAELISVQATIAIKNADNYSREAEAQKSLKKYSELVEMEKNKFQYSTFLHNKFTKMILNRNNSDDIISEVSTLLQTDVFIMDTYYSIVSYAGNFNDMKEKLDTIKPTIHKYVHSEVETCHFNKETGLWLLFYPIFVSEDVFGWIGVFLEENNLSEMDRIVIERCSSVIALEILKNYDMANLEQSIKGDYFDNLLKGATMDRDNMFYQRYKIDLSNPHRLVLVRLLYEQKGSPAYNFLRYFYQEINSLALESFSGNLVIQKRNLFILLINDNERNYREKFASFHSNLEEIAKILESRAKIQTRCVSIVSEKFTENEDLRKVYERTHKLFDIIPVAATSGCNFYEDFEVKKILLNNDRKDLIGFSTKVLTPLLDYTHSSKGELFETLKTYIYNGGNWTKTKNDLHIHGNTLTYRLNRVKELMDADFDDYQTRLRIQISLEITDLYPEMLNGL